MALTGSQYGGYQGKEHKQNRDNDSGIISSTPIVRVKQVFKSFGYNSNSSSSRSRSGSRPSHEVLSGVDITINRGEFITIVGPSGCGKSTLLNIIAGLDKPDSGDVSARANDGLSTARSIMIFQEGALFPWLSVQENVEFGLKIANIPKQERAKIASKYIELVGLTKFSRYFVHQLSGGMKQRVAIARALAMEPEILLMDEPFAALDVHTREMLYEELVGIHKTTNKTILFVTHNINEALLLGDRVLVMSAALRNIRKEFAIDLARPRDLESPELYELKRQILGELEGDLQQVASRR
jgi:NitT/TauT family transport system ATP-binding protein